MIRKDDMSKLLFLYFYCFFTMIGISYKQNDCVCYFIILIGTAATDNVKSQKVLERCGYQYIDEKILLVHVEGKEHAFQHYGFYPTNDEPFGCFIQ